MENQTRFGLCRSPTKEPAEPRAGLSMPSAESITEFKQIYAEEFGEEISDEYALALAVKLLGLFDNIYRPVKRRWDDEL